MATELYCTFILLLYLQGNYAQGLSNNQNSGGNNIIGLPQQPLQRTNIPNNINQVSNRGLNINLPQQYNSQQGNLQDPIVSSLQGNYQQSLSTPANLQPNAASGPEWPNLQINKQALGQLPPGILGNPSTSQISTQFNNNCPKQNAQISQQQNVGPASNVPVSQIQNSPNSCNSLAELAALKGYQPLLSLFASQNSAQPQQNQQSFVPNFNPAQNQLTDVQKQYLVKSLQSQNSVQNQAGLNFIQNQLKAAGAENQPTFTMQYTPVSSQQSQAIVTPVNNQPAFIKVQAQPLANYLQNQSPQVAEEPSVLSLVLSELQQPDSHYGMYPNYQVQKKEPKMNLKALIPLIINLLKEKSSCGCSNCGCPNQCSNNNVQEPIIFSGYTSQKNYSQVTEDAPVTNIEVDEPESKSVPKEKNVKKNIVNVDSEEVSEENDSEYTDDSEEE